MLLIIGIISLVTGALALLFSAFSAFGYYNVMDGSADLYARLHQRMTICLVVGIIFVLIGIVCMFIRCKK